jgi:PAS domain S-box-containing protein
MIKAPIPSDETERLNELLRMEILDSGPEAAFDDLTALASEICQSPISLISLVDKNRQWFKSKVGLSASETSRDVSFCGHAIIDNNIFEVQDSSKDERFLDNPLYTGAPHVRFYAGAPLVMSSGYKIGTLCVIDNTPKALNEWQKRTLEKLARQAVILIEARLREKNIKETTSRLENLLDCAQVGSWDWWIKENKAIVDRRWCDMLGLKIEEVQTSQNMWDERVHPQDKIKAEEDIKKYLDGKTNVYQNIQRMKHANGQWIWVLERGQISQRDESGTPIKFTGTQLNITQQKIIEQDLRDNQEKVSAIFETSNDAITLQKLDGHFFDCNLKALKMFGFENKEDFFQLNPTELSPTYQPNGELSEEKRKRILKEANDKGYMRFDWILKNRKSEEFPVEIVLTDFEFKGEKVFQATIRDMSEKLKLQKLNKEVERIAKIGGWEMSFAPDAQSWTDEVYRIHGMNPNASIDLNAAINHYLPEDKIKIQRSLDNAIHFAKPWAEEFKICDENKIHKWIKVVGEPIKNEHGKVYKIKGTIQDITENKLLQQRLEEQKRLSQHQAKLATIGELAAGVGHEINNPLTIIKGFLATIEHDLKNNLSDLDKIFYKLKKIDTASDRISNIVKGLRTFSRSDSESLSVFNLTETVQEAYSLINEILKKEGISLQLHFDPNKSLPVFGNKGRIEQVIFNLLTNAKDATENVSDRLIEIDLKISGKMGEIRIKDNGVGIPNELREKIFDPFFTTKDINKGTGIGLSIVNSIIKEHEGEISFESEINKGTCFIIKLPLKKHDLVEDGPTPDISTGAQKFQLKALVADDEEDIRSIMEAYLSSAGIGVTTVSDGKMALEEFLKGGFDLILTDLKMPKMNGLNLIKEIRNQTTMKQPKIILMTGGIDQDASFRTNLNETVEKFLDKPFNRELLVKNLEELFPDKKFKVK